MLFTADVRSCLQQVLINIINMEKYYQTFLDYLNLLEGYKTKFKNAHWSAPNLTVHKLIDDFLDELIEYQDAIAECSQGYMGKQYPMGSISAPVMNIFNITEAINTIDIDTAHFYLKIKDDNALTGIVNAVNDFQQNILKYKYLFSLSLRDGDSEFVSSIVESTQTNQVPNKGVMSNVENILRLRV